MPSSSELSSGSAEYGARIARRWPAGAAEAGVRVLQKARYCESTAWVGDAALPDGDAVACEGVAASEVVWSGEDNALRSPPATPLLELQPLVPATAAASARHAAATLPATRRWCLPR